MNGHDLSVVAEEEAYEKPSGILADFDICRSRDSGARGARAYTLDRDRERLVTFSTPERSVREKSCDHVFFPFSAAVT